MYYTFNIDVLYTVGAYRVFPMRAVSSLSYHTPYQHCKGLRNCAASLIPNLIMFGSYYRMIRPLSLMFVLFLLALRAPRQQMHLPSRLLRTTVELPCHLPTLGSPSSWISKRPQRLSLSLALVQKPSPSALPTMVPRRLPLSSMRTRPNTRGL